MVPNALPPGHRGAGPPVPVELPPPRPAEAARSARLGARIRAAIEAAGGSIPFERFMAMALYEPGLGYYRAGGEKIGAAGDFVTAPELSPAFAGCVARTVGAVLEAVGQAEVLEVGAGTGALAVGLLTALAGAGCVPARYRILETSADLAARQRAAVAALPGHLASRVEWVDDLPPPGFGGVILANELLDALPVRRFRREADAVREWHVAWGGDGFAWRLAESDAALAGAVEAIETALDAPLPPGYDGEVGLAARAWVATAAERLGRGALLLLDYGYPRRELYHPQRTAGTLTCHYRHRAVDEPLARVGLQDLSAHVDFSAVAAAGRAAGLEVAGFTHQGAFLLDTGLLDALSALAPGTVEHARAAHAVQRLVLPGEMGEVVKAIALVREVPAPLPGFGGRDLSDRL